MYPIATQWWCYTPTIATNKPYILLWTVSGCNLDRSRLLFTYYFKLQIMNILLIYPESPDTFWSFKHALKFISKKSVNPPLGLMTIASMLPFMVVEKIGGSKCSFTKRCTSELGRHGVY
jgi:hypothetical protein